MTLTIPWHDHDMTLTWPWHNPDMTLTWPHYINDDKGEKNMKWRQQYNTIQGLLQYGPITELIFWKSYLETKSSKVLVISFEHLQKLCIFAKFWRHSSKNWASHAHFNFKMFWHQEPSNFVKSCLLLWSSTGKNLVLIS